MSTTKTHWELEQLMTGGAWAPVLGECTLEPKWFETLADARRYAFRNWSSPKYVRIIRVVETRFLEE